MFLQGYSKCIKTKHTVISIYLYSEETYTKYKYNIHYILKALASFNFHVCTQA